MVWALAGRRGAVPLLEALQRRPELQKHAVHRDVLGRQQFLPAGLIQDAIEEQRRDLRTDQPLLVLRKARMVPHRLIERHARKPAKQDAVADLLGEHAVAADRVQGLKDERLQELLRRK